MINIFIKERMVRKEENTLNENFRKSATNTESVFKLIKVCYLCDK